MERAWLGSDSGAPLARRPHAVYSTRPDPATLLPLTGALAGEVRTMRAARGHTAGDLETALGAWAGMENLEERLVPGATDPVVLDLRRG
jgi:hypothetical protein